MLRSVQAFWMVRIFMCLLIGVSAVAAEDMQWQAGVGRTEITPTQAMWMAGYGHRDHPAEGTLTPLWCKALVLEDQQGHRAVLVTLDLVGIDRRLTLDICEQLKTEFGLERSQIAFCSSHTHTGPALVRNLAPLHYLVVDTPEQERIEAYSKQLVGKIVQSVRTAWNSLEPASLAWGSGEATFAVNRRENVEANVPTVRAAQQLSGPVNHHVPVLAIRNADQQLRCVVFGYACHATVLSFYQWSGDYPGFAQMELESHHPHCTAMFWAGCGADQNPLPRRSVALAQHYGRRLADAVDAVLLTSDMEPIEPSLGTVYQEVALPLDTLPSRTELQSQTESKDRFVVARAKKLLETLEARGHLEESYPYPIAVWKLGQQVDFVFLGGEVVVDYANRLMSELGQQRTWVAGYANDVMAYIPSRRVLQEGGYEGAGAMVYYGLPSPWAPDVEKIIVDEVQRQITRSDRTASTP
ncbi:MAG: neutral/alkaline non-lysosomal ceramidase N-terminal domain-containing protein [Pirellulaceae bacterium]